MFPFVLKNKVDPCIRFVLKLLFTEETHPLQHRSTPFYTKMSMSDANSSTVNHTVLAGLHVGGFPLHCFPSHVRCHKCA